MQLEQLQHSVLGPVKDFATCREVVTQTRPDLAFMDLRLANGDSGEEVAQWLLAEHNIRCVFMSGNLDDLTQQGGSRRRGKWRSLKDSNPRPAD